MSLFFNLFLFLIVIFDHKLLALTDYKIKELCKREIKRSFCIKNLHEKNLNLQKGNQIEIPVVPYKK